MKRPVRLFAAALALSLAIGCATTCPDLPQGPKPHPFASKGNTFENDLLGITLNGTAIANIADNAASSPLTNLYLTLHTADPGEGGSCTTSEASYTGYSRTAIARSSGSPAWTVASGAASNAALITGAACTGGSNTITFFSICTVSSGAGKILYSGALSASLAISNLITPQFAIGALQITED